MTHSQNKHVFRNWCAGIALRCFIPLAKLCFGNLGVRGTRFWGNVFYAMSYPFLGGKRRVADENLAVAFPEKSASERLAIRRGSFHYLMELGLDWCHFLARPKAGEENTKLSENAQKIYDSHLHEKKAAIYCTMHFGNWELLAHTKVLTGRPLTVVAAEFSIPYLNRMIQEFRRGTSDDVQFIDVHGAAFGAMRSIRNGQDVGILIDQCVSPKSGGKFVPFFGLPAATSKLPASIVHKMGARLPVLGCRKKTDGSFFVEAEEIERPCEDFADEIALTAGIMEKFEAIIRKAPEQYLWMYPRWRYRPVNCPERLKGRFPSYAKEKYAMSESELNLLQGE